MTTKEIRKLVEKIRQEAISHFAKAPELFALFPVGSAAQGAPRPRRNRFWDLDFLVLVDSVSVDNLTYLRDEIDGLCTRYSKNGLRVLSQQRHAVCTHDDESCPTVLIHYFIHEVATFRESQSHLFRHSWKNLKSHDGSIRFSDAAPCCDLRAQHVLKEPYGLDHSQRIIRALPSFEYIYWALHNGRPQLETKTETLNQYASIQVATYLIVWAACNFARLRVNPQLAVTDQCMTRFSQHTANILSDELCQLPQIAFLWLKRGEGQISSLASLTKQADALFTELQSFLWTDNSADGFLEFVRSLDQSLQSDYDRIIAFLCSLRESRAGRDIAPILDSDDISSGLGVDLGQHERSCLNTVLSTERSDLARLFRNISCRRAHYYFQQCQKALSTPGLQVEEERELLIQLCKEVAPFAHIIESEARLVSDHRDLLRLVETTVDSILFCALRICEFKMAQGLTVPSWLFKEIYQELTTRVSADLGKMDVCDEANVWWALCLLLTAPHIDARYQGQLNDKQRRKVRQILLALLNSSADEVKFPSWEDLRLEITPEIMDELRTRLYIIKNALGIAEYCPSLAPELTRIAIRHWRRVAEEKADLIYHVALRYEIGTQLRETANGVANTIGVLERQTTVHGTEGESDKRFDIALSFPGEHRDFVARVAQALAERLGKDRLLYDAYYEAEFARTDLDTYLQGLYRDESELIVIFLCADYDRKRWCKLEWRAIKDLIATKDTSAIMPVRFDKTEIPGLFSGDGYVEVKGRTPQKIAELILQRWQLRPR